MSSAFDDLLNFGDSTGNVNQSADPFDPLGTSQSGGGDLLDLGFDAPISTQNGSSAKVNFEANTNPLYELSNSQNAMESEASNPLFELSAEPQKETKMESSGNPLYDYLQGETTNGHSEELVLTNGGANNDVDLLGLSGDVVATGALTSDDSGVTLDSNNLNESNPEVELELEPEPEPELEQEPEPEVVTQERSRTNSEASEPEEQKQVAETAEHNETLLPEETETPSKTIEEIPDQEVGPGENDQGESLADKEETQTENVREADQKVANEATEPEAEKVDETPTEIGETVTTDKEQQVETGKAPETEAEESKEIPVETVGEMSEATEFVQETIPENETQPESLEENKEDVADKTEEQVSAGPEPSAAESMPEELPEQKEAENEDVPKTIEDKDDQTQPATIKDEPEQPESEPVQAPVTEPAEVESSALEPTAVKEGPTEVDQPVPLQDEVEQTVSEPAEAEPAAPEPELAVSEPAKVESAAPEPKQVEQVAVEQTEVEQTAPAAAEVEQAAPETAEEEHAVPQPETTEPIKIQQALPESGMVEQIETQQPTPEPVLVEEEKTEEVAASAPEIQQKDQPSETAVESTDAGNEDQTVPETPAEKTNVEADDSAPAENGVAKVNGTNEVKENGVTEEEAVRDPSIFRETREKEEIHFAEMNSFRQKFESGKIDDKEPEPKKTSLRDEYDEGGEFENEPVQNPDVVKETDQAGESLPEAGTAQNLLSKFKSIQEEKAQTVTSQKRASPPRQEKVEYESTPAERLVIEECKSDMGEFESTPQAREDVVRSGDAIEDAKPEEGATKNIMNKFKEIESSAGASQPREKREITPDSSGKVEYVSEPRGQKIQYEENRADAGVFENQPTGEEEDVVRSEDRAEEVMPESGSAKNLLSKFRQMESEAGNRPPPSPKREVKEITPDRSGKVEYVSEPRGKKIQYGEQLEDQGIFESKPAEAPEVIRSEDMVEDVKPETGSAKKTLERYKEMQKQSASPVSSTPHKEITPPREGSPGKTVAGVVENNPSAAREDVVRSGDRLQDELPEQGSAKNILSKFKEIESSAGTSPAASPTKKPKEFTPPPEYGVYENKPAECLVIEEQQSFEGIVENTPAKSQADVARDHDRSVEKELPETGMAKNLVSKFRQLETTSAKTSSSTSPRFKEFTPPRDRGPLSPKSPAGQPSDGVNLSELPGQYQQQGDKPGIFENEPEVRPDVYREADTDYEAGLPAPNTTLSVLQKFKSIQDQAKEDQKTPAPISRKEKGMFKVVQTEKCDACQKTVYAMEKLEMNSHIYHKNCFKCSHCSARLTPKTFSMNEGVIYCVNHFKQLFARKGNYDEGFGRQQYKKKWNDPKKEVATA